METLIIRERGMNGPPGAILCIRRHDLGGTDYGRLVSLDFAQASSILAGTARGERTYPVDSLMAVDRVDPDARPGRLHVSQRPDTTLEGRNFMLELRREGDAPELLGYLSTDHVDTLRRCGADIDLEPGEPDRESLGIRITALQIRELRDKADALEKQLADRIGTGRIKTEAAEFVDSVLVPGEDAGAQRIDEDDSEPR